MVRFTGVLRISEGTNFSRQPIHPVVIPKVEKISIFKKVCVISFRRGLLLTYAKVEPTPLEQAEWIDILRILGMASLSTW